MLAAFFGSMLLHALADLPLHAEDAHRHFLPFSHYRFISPISYWDVRYHAREVAIVETLVVAGAAAFLWRDSSLTARVLFSAIIVWYCRDVVEVLPAMSALAALCTSWLVLMLAGAACAAAIKAVKYRGFSVDAALAVDDLAWVAGIELVLALLGSLGPAGAVVGLLGGALFYFALWLDAVLFRIFTIELGPGGVGSVILSVLYRELAELSFARRFFSSHRLFAALPAAAVVAHASLFLQPGGRAHAGLMLGLGVYLVAATWVCTAARARRRALGACGALLGVSAGMPFVPGAAVPAAASVLGCLVIARALHAWRGRPAGPSGIHHFLFERPRPRLPSFQPRAEHAHVADSAPRPPRPSDTHGLLRGQDVVLLTFESVGRLHLSATAPGGAHASFFQGTAAPLPALAPPRVPVAHH